LNKNLKGNINVLGSSLP